MMSNFMKTMVIVAVMVMIIGCGKAVSQDNGTDKGLVVYAPSSAQDVIAQAKSHGLPVKILNEGDPSTDLVKILLEVPKGSKDPYFAVVNTNQQSMLTGGVLDKDISPEQQAKLFDHLQKIQQSGEQQAARLKPGDSGHVNITVFSDFQCPYCKQMDGLLNQWEAKYGDKLNVQMINFPLPFHANALPAAEAAECARLQNKFDPYREALFKNQSALSSELYPKLAKDLGLNTEEFNQCIAEHKTKETVQNDKYFGEYMGIKGTPSVFVDGKPIQGVSPKEIETMIDAKLGTK